MEHQFKEAFCLMYYENDETKLGFIVWNSRNGVSPFNVFEDGKQYQHTHWGMDIPVTNTEYIKSTILKKGQRIFRDVTEAEAKQFAIKRLQSAEGTPYEVEEGSERWNELLGSLTESFGKPGEPTMVVVMEDGIMP